MGCEPRGDKSGGIAQLGERLHGMQEVNGSIPFISTKFAVTGRRKYFQGSVKKNCHGPALSWPCFSKVLSPSSSGLGHRPFTAVTGVRVPHGAPITPPAR